MPNPSARQTAPIGTAALREPLNPPPNGAPRVVPKSSPTPPIRRRTSWLIWLIRLGLLLAVTALGYIVYRHFTAAPAQTVTGRAGAGGAHQGGAGKISVVTAKAAQGQIGVYLRGLGSVIPNYTVTVKSRISGQLIKVFFVEGQLVHEGDLLVQIDPRPYTVALEQAQAQLAHDQALLQNAQLDLARYQTLWAQDSIPKQTLDTQVYLVAQDQGTVQLDQASIDNAKLNLIYCNITAPITGRVGLRQVDPGNMINTTDANGLVVITQVQPITVQFTIPEDNVPEVMEKLNANQTLSVEAYDRSSTHKLAAGTLLTTDNQIDTSTGTLRLKALFSNEDGTLFPNQFVNIRLLVEMKQGVTLVPNAAVQHGTQNTFVYVVTDEQTVEMTPVELGTSEGEITEITQGVQPGDTVVIDGVDKLQDGTKVIAKAPPDANGTPGAAAGATGGAHHHRKSGDPTAAPTATETSATPTAPTLN